MVFTNAAFAQAGCPDCKYTLTVADSFGDGWNGASITVSTPTEVITNAGPTDGSGPEDICFAVNSGDVVTVTENAAGTFANEVSYFITGPTGDTPVNVPTGTFTGNSTFSFAAVCPPPPVCAEGECALAVTLTFTDNFGDGWDDSTLTVDVGGEVNPITTVISDETVTYTYADLCIAENGSVDINVDFVDNTAFDNEVTWDIAVTTDGIFTDPMGLLTRTAGEFGAFTTSSESGTITVTCPPVEELPTPTITCGIYEIGKSEFVQAPGVSAECTNGFNCAPAGMADCTAAAADATGTTTGSATATAAATSTAGTTFSIAYAAPGADPLGAIELVLCAFGDIDGTGGNREAYDFTFEDGSTFAAGETGTFADQCNPAGNCVTVCVPASSDANDDGSLDITVARTAQVSTTLCNASSGDFWSADATFFFVPAETDAPTNACVSWFAGPCSLDEAFFIGENLPISVIQDLIAAGDLDPSTLCHEGIATFFVEISCGGAPSDRIPVNIFVFDTCAEGCPQYLELTDGGGDGWEGAKLMVSVNEGASEEIKLTAAQGGCFVYQYCVQDGGSLDIQYWEGGDNAENGYNVIGFDGEVLLAEGPSPSTEVRTVKASCPDVACEGSTVDATVRVTVGQFPDFMSWEIYDGFNNVNCQGPQVFGINANTYAGLAPGTQITYPLTLEACNEYTVALFDGFNIGWNGGTWELISSDIDYGTEITNPNDPFFGQSSVKIMTELDFGPANDLNSALPGDEARMAFTFPCKPDCTDATQVSIAGSCVGAELILPVAEPEVCYPDCNHALGCDIQIRHTVLISQNDNNAILLTDFIAYTGQTEVDYAGIVNGTIQAGCHSYVTEYLYCDGLITKCTADYTVFVPETSNFTCNDNVTVPLSPPNANPTEGGFVQSFSDDLGECVIRITADMVIEAGVPSILACEFANFNDFYEVIILDANDQPLVVFSSRGLPLDSNGAEILPGQNTVPANNFVSYNEIKQTLKYVVTHKITGTTCWGELTVEDKNAPTIICVDYDVNCNDPNALDEFYSETTTLQSSAAAELPFNIAGGDVGVLRSNTWIPFTVPCGRLGTTIQDIQVSLSLTHNEVTDLGVELHIPDHFNATLVNPFPGGILILDQIGDVGAVNTYTPNPVNDSPSLLGLLGASCKTADSHKDVEFVSESTGDATPEGYGKTWYLRVTDNGVSFPVPPFGGGQITAASLTITCGYPFPYLAFDCALDNVELISEIIESNCALIADWNGAQIKRVWKATDACGQSSTCTQTVNLKAPRIADLTLPENNVDIECGTEQLLPDGSVDPAQAGAPEFCCDQVTDEDFCKLTISYEDDVFESCGDSYKVIRTWTVFNWCLPTNAPIEYTQLIVVGDHTGPIVNVGNAITIDANDDCEGALDLSALDITDACSAITGVRLEYTTGSTYAGTSTNFIVDLFAGQTATGLPAGTTNATLIATDECFNTTSVDLVINVVDNNIPTAICDDGLNISLNSNGTARVFATDFDEGSNDNCSDVTVAIRSLGCVGGGFAEFADFACCDLGTVRVELQVTDANGNSNICWADLLVEDPIGPQIVCKPDATITCDEALHADGGFSDPEGTDNCGVSITAGDITTVELANCGQLLTRTYTATDGSDKSNDVSCSQTITVVHVSDFIVQFPSDLTIDTCPEDLGDIPGPIVTEDDCENIGISVEDRTFVQVEDACYKIERTYTIVNHCIVENPSAGGFTDLGTPLPIPRTFRDDDGYFQYTQIIKVTDSEAPTLSFTAPDPCDFTDGCEGEVVLIATGEDACSDLAALEFSFKIDAFSDGTFDIEGNGADATGTFPYGDHIIKWIVTDGCGNVTAEEFPFSVRDCKNPTPVCQGVTTVVMNDGSCVAIWALDLLEYAEDNCTERTDEEWDDNARIRREGDNGPLTTSLDICCADVTDGAVNVEVWIEDEAGNADFCIVSVVIQDNLGNCDDGATGSSLLSGTTATEVDNKVDNVEVSINSNVVMTNYNGVYSSSEQNNSMYEVTPEKLDGVAEGITTFDLVLMAQHVLQINELTTPYQLIAADVNLDAKIDIFDMVELRSLILFSISEFSNNTSWKFVDADYTFQNPTAPWSEAYPQSISVMLNEAKVEDFIAVKIGDLSGDAKKSSFTTAEERSFPTTLTMNIDDVEMTAGNTYKVDFRASDFNDITGYQFTMNFDQNAANFISVEAGALNVDESNFGFTMLDEGIITTSFTQMGKGVSVENDEVLFSINFTANANATLQNVLSLTNQYTLAEAYNTESEVSDLNIAFNNAGLITTTGGDFELFQNKPNPFNESTLIGFNLPAATTATLRIYDVSGKTLKVITANYARGFNQVNVNRNDLGAAGVLYYQLDTDSDSAVKKMIILE